MSIEELLKPTSMKESYTRTEVINIIENLLEYPDMITDAMTNENTEHTATSILEVVEEGIMAYEIMKHGYDAYKTEPHWLEEKENVYVLTEKEFKILLEETWMNGHGIGCHNERHMAGLPIKDRMKQAATDIEQFLQSKTNPQT